MVGQGSTLARPSMAPMAWQSDARSVRARPRWGRDVPGAPWLTEWLESFVERWRVPTEPAQHDDPERRLHVRQGGLRRPSRHGGH